MMLLPNPTKVLSLMLFALMLLVGCGDGDDHPAKECGEHGEQHGDHCDCDDGYHEVDGSCVPEETGADPCGEHGEQHGDHCHCDAGYVESGLSCVPVVTVLLHGRTDHRHRHSSALVKPVQPPVGHQLVRHGGGRER